MNIILKVYFAILLIIFVLPIFTGCTENEIEWGDAPDFTLTTIDGDNFSLSENVGRIIVIDLMATWCGPCIQQMTQLEKLADEYGDNILVISIDIDTRETKNDIINEFSDYTDKWLFMMDNSNHDVSNLYDVSSIPKIYIIDQNGNIYYSHVGYTDYSTLSEKILDLLE